jgi:hypothetical protein
MKQCESYVTQCDMIPLSMWVHFATTPLLVGTCMHLNLHWPLAGEGCSSASQSWTRQVMLQSRSIPYSVDQPLIWCLESLETPWTWMSTLDAKLNRSLLRYYMFLLCIPNTFLPLSDVSGTSIRILLDPGPVLRFSASYHPASRDQGGYSS